MINRILSKNLINTYKIRKYIKKYKILFSIRTIKLFDKNVTSNSIKY